MKLMLGVLMAGVLTGSVAAVNYAGTPPDVAVPPAAAAKEGGEAAGAPRIEHLAWCPAGFMYLDGPRLEAMTPDRPRLGLADDAGNVYFGKRCLDRQTGIISTLTDDYWECSFGQDEGPAATFSNYEPYPVDFDTGSQFVSGRPLDGGDKGCLYFTEWNSCEVKRLWKNTDRGGRWWFKRIAGGGKTPLPQSKGGTVPALEAKLSGGNPMLQVMPDNRLIIFAHGGFYEYRDGNLVCLLGPDDHKSGRPKMGAMGGDGTFYLGYYFGGREKDISPLSVIRVLPDGKAEPYVTARLNAAHDGHGMQVGFFCGPHFWTYMLNYKFIPKDVLILVAHDENYFRRALNGRVSTLCRDGEWRELAYDKKDAGNALQWYKWLRGGFSSSPGPNGTAISAYGGSTPRYISFLVTGVDWGKPTVGPPLPDLPPTSVDDGRPKPGKAEDGK